MDLSIEDLLDNYKLQATIHPNYTTHPTRTRDPKARPETRWDREERIGQGNYGQVWRELNCLPGGPPKARAVKVLEKQRMRNQVDFKKEILALSKLSKQEYREAEVIVSFLGWFENDKNVFLAMEYFEHGDLGRHIMDVSTEDEVRQITTDLLQGLKIMHAEGFAHRDLKPQNIFVVQKPPLSEKWWVKIGDFGISKRVRNEDTALRTQTGTPYFQAPEIQGFIDSDNDTSEYSNAIDIWSLGCIVYNISAHRVPFYKPSEVNKYCQNRLPFPREALHPILDAAGVSFVECLLLPEPAQRSTIESALKDLWILGGTPDATPANKIERLLVPETAQHSSFEGALNDPEALIALQVVASSGYYEAGSDQPTGGPELYRSHHTSIGSCSRSEVQTPTGDERSSFDRNFQRTDSRSSLTTSERQVNNPDAQVSMQQRQNMYAVYKDSAKVTNHLYEAPTKHEMSPYAVRNYSLRSPSLHLPLSSEPEPILRSVSPIVGSKMATRSVWQSYNIPLGHEEAVYGITTSSNRQLLASCSRDKTVRVWNLSAVVPLPILKGHRSTVLGIAFSPDRKILASCSADNTIRLWRVGARKFYRVITGHDDVVRGVAFSPDGRLLASCSKDRSVRVFVVSGGDRCHNLRGHAEAVNEVYFSPDGKLIASCSSDKTVRLWDIETGTSRHILKGHTGAVYDIAFSPDGRLLASCSYDRTVRLWDITTGESRHIFIGHRKSIRAVTFSINGELLASCSEDETIRLWNVRTGDLFDIVTGHTGTVHCAAFLAEYDVPAFYFRNKPVQSEHQEIDGTDYTRDVTPLPCYLTLVSCSDDKTVRIWRRQI